MQNNQDYNEDKEVFDKLTIEAWEKILTSIQELKDNKHTFSEIAQSLGVKNRSLVCEWLNKKRELPLSSIASLLYYLDVFGYAIQANKLVKKEELLSIAKVNSENAHEENSVSIFDIEKLKEENAELKMKNRVLQEILVTAIDTKKLKKSQKKEKN